VNYY